MVVGRGLPRPWIPASAGMEAEEVGWAMVVGCGLPRPWIPASARMEAEGEGESDGGRLWGCPAPSPSGFLPAQE